MKGETSDAELQYIDHNDQSDQSLEKSDHYDVPTMTHLAPKLKPHESEPSDFGTSLDESEENVKQPSIQSCSQFQSPSSSENSCKGESNQSKNLSVLSGSRRSIEPRGH